VSLCVFSASTGGVEQTIAMVSDLSDKVDKVSGERLINADEIVKVVNQYKHRRPRLNSL
jgi:hypothetical protein